jgi:hypothetical protein
MGPPDKVHDAWAPYLDEGVFAAMTFYWDSGRGYGFLVTISFTAWYVGIPCRYCSGSTRNTNRLLLSSQWMFLQAVYMAKNGTTPPTDFEEHALHCVEYLRQSTICAAYNIIERSYKGVFRTFEANNTHVYQD